MMSGTPFVEKTTIIEASRRKSRNDQILIFLFCVLTNLALNFMVRTITSLPTELTSLAISAKLVGYNWSDVVSSTGYYGTGFYVLFTPLLALIKNPYILHQAYMAAIACVNAIPPILCYRLMTRNFHIDSRLFCILVSISMAFYSVVHPNVVINEHALNLISWLVFYVLVQSAFTASKKSKIVYSILAALLLGYSVTIHTRALLFIAAVIAAIGLYLLVHRKWLVNPLAFTAVLAAAYLFADKYVKSVTSLIWGSVNTSELANTGTSTMKAVLTNLSLLTTRNGIVGFLNIILGQTYAATIYSAGTFLFIIMAGGYLLFLSAGKLFRKREFIIGEQDNRPVYSVILFVCLLCVGVTIVAHGVISLHGTSQTVQSWKGARAYFYLRYFYHYLQPAFMVSMCLLFEKLNVFKKRWYIVTAFFAALSAYIFVFIVPTTILGPTLELDRNHYLSALSLNGAGRLLTPACFVAVTAVTAMLLLLYYLFMRKDTNRGKEVIALIIAVVITYECAYYAFNFVNYEANMYYSNVNAFLEIIRNDDELNNRLEVVYYNKPGLMRHVLQYEMMNHPVLFVLPDTTMEDVVILSNIPIEAPDEHYKMAVLDDNEYLYVKGDGLLKLFSDNGVSFTSDPFFITIFNRINETK